MLPSADDSGDLVQKSGIALTRAALLFVVHVFVRCLKWRLAQKSDDVLVRQVVLAGSRILRRNLKPRHVSRSFLRLNRENGAIFHVRAGAKGHAAFVPALLWLVHLVVVGPWAGLEGESPGVLSILEPALCASFLLILHLEVVEDPETYIIVMI